MGTIWNNSDGLDVHYGRRTAGERANFGYHTTKGGDVELVFYLQGSDFTSGTATYNGTTITIPAGFTVRSVIAEVTEAFAAGASTALYVGVSGSVATNYVATLAEAALEAVGVYNVTPGGTLAANTPLAASQTLTATVSGGTATITGSAGKLKVVVKAVDPAAA